MWRLILTGVLILCADWCFGAVHILYEATPTRGAFEVSVPAKALTAGDREDGEFSLWLRTTGAQPEGWTWAHVTRPDECYVTDGTHVSPLLNPTDPAWGDSGPQPPGKVRELKFALPEGLDLDHLTFVQKRPPFRWNGSVDPAPLTVEIWKGLRVEPSVFVDNANRCCFIDASLVPSDSYRFTFPGERVVTSSSPVIRRRLPENPKPFSVKVEAKTRREGRFSAEVRVVPHATPLAPPLPNEKVLVGQCVYDGDARFRDEIITNGLANLLVGWSKATDYTNMPVQVERAMAERDVHFMTIYGWAGRDVTDALKARWGTRYLWNNIGEFSGYLYQGLSSAEMCRVPQDATDTRAARDWYINTFVRNKVIDEHRRCDYFLSTSGSALAAYELQGGVDFMCTELYAIGAQNLAYATSEMRGSARKWKPEYWGGWLAEEWQTCNIPFAAPEKMALLRAGLYQQYLMGTSLIVLESGAQTTQAEKYTAEAKGVKQLYDDPTPRAYRETVKDFYDWVKAHPRDTGTPETKIALALGNNDSFVGMNHGSFAIWAQHKQAETNLNWKYGASEANWDVVKDVFFPRPKDAIAPYPNNFLAGSPFGQVDIVSVDDEARLADLTRYDLLVYGGWNTMTPHIKRVLAKWVREGGTLVLCLPQLLGTAERKGDAWTAADLVDDGDLRPLLPYRVVSCSDDGARFEKAHAKGGRGKPFGRREPLVEQVGKGRVVLCPSKRFPSEDSALRATYAETLRTQARGVKQSVTLTGDDAEAISYAVYPHTVYALNVDCQKARTVTINGKEVVFAPGEMKEIPREKACDACLRTDGTHAGWCMGEAGTETSASGVTAWVDKANRCAFVDASALKGDRYVFSFPDGTSVTSRLAVCRRRLPEKPEPFSVRVATYTGGSDLQEQGEVRVVPHEKALMAPLPNEKVLVGQCVYGEEARFRDEIITNGLANLLVGWTKATDYTNMPSVIEQAMAENDVHFMTIYGWAGRETTDALKARWGTRYLWNNIGEYSGYLYQVLSSAEACGVPQDAADLREARDWYINTFIRRKVIDEHSRCDFFFTTSGSPLAAYELQGGVDFMCTELYAVGAHNLAYATSEMRGAARKWKPEYWGGWLAEEWQTFPVPYTSKQKYDLLKVGLYQQYLMGTSIIVLESGAQTTQAEKYTAGAEGIKQLYDEPAPQAYRATVKEFYDWVKAHPRDNGTPETRIALVLGNTDGYVGMSHEFFAAWGQHQRAATNLNWKCGAPEATWQLAQDVFYPLAKDALAPYPNEWLAGSPYGQVDVVSVDDDVRLADIARYDLLVYAGWNTMTPHIMDVLAAWVRGGGELVIGLPHFLATADRDFTHFDPKRFVNGGNLRPLVDRTVTGPLKPGVEVTELGKGRVHFVTEWAFPGANRELGERWQQLVRERAAAVKRSVTVSGDDTPFICYAVYPKTVYALNVDCVRSRTVEINGERHTFGPAEVKVLPRL